MNSSPVAASPGVHPAVWAVASALLLFTSFPPTNWGWLGWVALAPLFLLVRSERSRWSVYGGALLGGFVFWLLAVQWVRKSDESAWLAWIVMAGFLALWWPGFLLLARTSVRRLKLPLMVAAPIAWVALEFLRAHILSGFPWYYLAHSQFRVLPLIQVADLTGVWGLSFLVAMANALWVDLMTLPLLRPSPKGPRLDRPQARRLAVMAGLLVATLGYGFARIHAAHFREGPRLALLQSNFKQEYKMGSDPQKIVDAYKRLTQRALDGGPDLIVWPETAYPYGYAVLDPRVAREEFERQVRSISREAKLDTWVQKIETVPVHLHGWVDRLGVPMVVGTSYYDFRPGGLARYNAAVLFEPKVREVQAYHKLHLVPFGEYVPFIKTFPALIRLTPFDADHIPSLNFGEKPLWFELKGWRIATAICFEDTVPHVVRRFFSEAPDGRQPDVVLNLSNDGWFYDTAEHEVHLATSVFRAVENRVPLARAVNTGISALIDGNGKILASLQQAREGVLSVVVPLDDRVGLYSSWGDWLPISCVAVSLGLIPLAMIRTRKAAA
jgi:apolipoprotein N-acyltransferase